MDSVVWDETKVLVPPCLGETISESVSPERLIWAVTQQTQEGQLSKGPYQEAQGND